jgi:hypothetical protein
LFRSSSHRETTTGTGIPLTGEYQHTGMGMSDRYRYQCDTSNTTMALGGRLRVLDHRACNRSGMVIRESALMQESAWVNRVN